VLNTGAQLQLFSPTRSNKTSKLHGLMAFSFYTCTMVELHFQFVSKWARPLALTLPLFLPRDSMLARYMLLAYVRLSVHLPQIGMLYQNANNATHR